MSAGLLSSPAAGVGGGEAAAQLYDGSGFRLVREPLPALGPGEALIEVELTTLCGSDLHTLAGHRSTPLPTVLGHEAIGRVVALGAERPGVEHHPALDGVRSPFARPGGPGTGPGTAASGTGVPGAAGGDAPPIAVGDRVTWTVAASCGACDRCLGGLEQKCRSLLKYGHEAVSEAWRLNGGLATHVHLLAGTMLARVPEALPAALLAPANCATATVAAAARRVGLSAGDAVVVVGCGLLGLTAVAYARWLGATSVVAVDVDAARRALALEFGADRVCAPSELAAAAGARGASVVLELSGHPTGVEQAVAVAEVGARVAFVGSVSEGATTVILDPAVIVRRMLSVVGSHNYGALDLFSAVDFLGWVGADPALTAAFTAAVSPAFELAELPAALVAARGGRWARVALRP
jgi:putative phosphonate catabolism associated alcohol dehydrogenase